MSTRASLQIVIGMVSWWGIGGVTLAGAVPELDADAVKCVKALNGAAHKVAKAEGVLVRKCLKDTAKGVVADADACVLADAKAKVAKAVAKTVELHGKKCLVPPSFAYAGADAVNEAATTQAEALMRDVRDGGLGFAVTPLADDKDGANCQKNVTTAVDKLLGTLLQQFNKCKKAELVAVVDAAHLRDLCLGSLTAARDDPSSRVAKSSAKIEKARLKSCPAVDLAAALPGRCADVGGGDLAACLEARAHCRACLLLTAVDVLDADCDLFDDGLTNASCGDAGTTTSTSTTTTTSTVSTTSSSTTSTSVTSTSLALPTTTTTLIPFDFLIAIGDTVSDGVPGAGAGNVETAGSIDVYAFDATAGQVVYFDELGVSGVFGLGYTIVDPDGATIVSNVLGGGEPGRLVLARTGRYWISVGNVANGDTGTYSFKLWDVPADDAFAIAIGDTVSDGVPGAGAGHIEVPSVRDVYTFSGTAGQVIYFDEQGSSGTFGLAYRVELPSGGTYLTNVLGGGEPGLLVLPETGTYTIRVGADTNDSTGTYSFTLWAVPAADMFAIAIGDSVSDGVPAAGAGNIEVPSARDVYTFSGTAGQVIYFDEQGSSGTFGLAYRVELPSGGTYLTNVLGGAEPGRLTLPETGTYTIEVGADTNDSTGTYSFRLWAVPADDMFAIAIGDSVSDGVPAAGAGNIEVPSVRDVYTFSGTTGQVIYFDEQSSSGTFGLAYRVELPSGGTYLTNVLGGAEPGQLTLPETGTYTIEVGADTNDSTGTYSFRLWAVPADDMFAIAIGDTVSDGVPAAGAGNIEVPSVRDVYTFSGTAGEMIYFDELSATGTFGLAYRVELPSGGTYLTNVLGGAEPGQLTLPETGTYTIEVGADTNDSTGTYSFSITSVP